MSDWNPTLYLRFEDERTRPALELLGRVPLDTVTRAVDLGCGPGNSTELLARRWPDADVLGVDTSDAMLAEAGKRLPGARFEKGDAASWQAAAAPDLIFANAVMQWVPGHAALLPRLLGQTAPGGVLAIQVPDNLDEASHRLMRETAGEGPWAAKLGDAAALRDRIPPAGAYYDQLAGHATLIDIWRTTYYHVLDDAAAIVSWVRATGLRPFLDPLDEAEKAGFITDYTARIAKAYPARADGKVLLAFPRLFIVAKR
ncbi:trans-aconitate 2-methyltransferase [Labrys monachus]|uniref:Trans-aconitate 2-methyltransferase n=1 Tax=Labrys monachus TaxID=217067 RepID=A0ABU0FKZ3_9HYPH|nr:trans-aconitate 2-methyltransferase [Labrys monachus]MDQ0395278.1 trans-aconitate 2-methyltransferase [Labrys monachus]